MNDTITVRGTEFERLVARWLGDILAMVRTSRDMATFAPTLRRYVVSEVLTLESQSNYGAIPEVEAIIQDLGDRLAPDWGSEAGQAADGILTMFLGGVILLLGTESRVLVGVRGGRPTWKKIVRIAPEEVVFALRDTILTTYGVKRNVGPKEAWMVPDFREFDLEGKKRYEQDGGYLETNRTLIENAFYKQRYLTDPEGVFVKVTNARDVTGIYLKACSGGGDLVDILVRLETIRGAIFFNITEERLLEDVRASSVWLNGESYYDYLVCQVYHDLVTAMTVSGTRTIRDGLGVGASTPPQGDEPTWTVIPRKVRNVVREPRAEIPQRSVTEPHRVTGHLRKAAMTDKHREELVKFERETGLEVLRFVPEGYTFVRPHVSPRASAEDLAALPRFIRYRIQQALEAKMKARELRD